MNDFNSNGNHNNNKLNAIEDYSNSAIQLSSFDIKEQSEKSIF